MVSLTLYGIFQAKSYTSSQSWHRRQTWHRRQFSGPVIRKVMAIWVQERRWIRLLTWRFSCNRLTSAHTCLIPYRNYSDWCENPLDKLGFIFHGMVCDSTIHMIIRYLMRFQRVHLAMHAWAIHCISWQIYRIGFNLILWCMQHLLLWWSVSTRISIYNEATLRKAWFK